MIVCFQWASVASWFFRPECSLLATMAGNEQPSTFTSGPVHSVTSARTSDQMPSSTSEMPTSRPPSTTPRREQRSERTFQMPTICTVSTWTFSCNFREQKHRLIPEMFLIDLGLSALSERLF